MRMLLVLLASVLLCSGCSKTPESEAANRIGKQPKQLIDKVTGDLNKAMQKDAERRQEAEKKE